MKKLVIVLCSLLLVTSCKTNNLSSDLSGENINPNSSDKSSLITESSSENSLISSEKSETSSEKKLHQIFLHHYLIVCHLEPLMSKDTRFLLQRIINEILSTSVTSDSSYPR